MLVVPEFGAEGIVLKKVEVINPLDRQVSLDFDDAAIRSGDEGEAIRGLTAGLGFGHFRLNDCATLARYIEGHDMDFGALPEQSEPLTNVHDLPAKVPERGLWLCGRGRLHLIEEQIEVAGFESGESGERDARGAGELVRVKRDCTLGVSGIEMDVVEARRGKRCLGYGGRSQDQGQREAEQSQRIHFITCFPVSPSPR